MKFWSLLVAGVVVLVPASVAADVAELENTATPTRAAERVENATPIADPPPPQMSGESLQILALVNNERTSRGLAPMRLDSSLNDAAQVHSAVQASAASIFHIAPDGSNPGERIARTGYRFSTWGENVAACYLDADAVMAAWMGSSGHCRNILNPAFTELGVGYVKRDNDPSRYYDYWTQVFARPSGEPAPPGSYDSAWC